MLRLTERQRLTLVEKLPDTANLAIGALSFGQFVGDQDLSIGVVLLGVAVWLGLFGWSLLLSKKD